LIILFTEVVVNPLTKAPASTTTKVVVPVPISDGGLMVTAPPEIVTDEDETPIVENAVPDALFALNVILPVPVDTPTLKVIMILDAKATPVAPIAGLKVMGCGGIFIEVAVRTPTVIVSLRIFEVFAIPVRFAPLPLKEVAVTTPTKLAPVLTFPTSCTLVTDILLLFSYLSLKEVKVHIHSTLIITTSCTMMRY
jgi:hypothetical protein